MTHTFKSALTLFSVFILVLQTAAFAESTYYRRSSSSSFGAYDANGDGVITQEEWLGKSRSFETCDYNHDGRLSRGEVHRWGTRYNRGDGYQGNPDGQPAWIDHAESHLNAWDTDKNGVVTRDEWHGGGDMFARLDKNGDGLLPRDEFLNAQEWIADMPAAARESAYYVSVAGQPAWVQHAQNHLNAWDTDKNSIVTRAEWHGGQDMFNRMDRNGDSSLSRSEFFDQREWTADMPAAQQASAATRPAWVDHAEWHMNTWDTDRDNRITRSEWHGGQDMFSRMDRNGDRVLSSREFFNQQEWTADMPAAQQAAARQSTSPSSGASSNNSALEQILLQLFNQ